MGEVMTFFLIGFSPLIPVFVLSLITYWLSDSVFNSWLRFAYWTVPILAIVVLLLSYGNYGGGLGGIVAGSFVLTAIALSFLTFFLVSLIVIAGASQSSKRH
jgi:energy-coupling factor transporter transmembrane protein EcfT